MNTRDEHLVKTKAELVKNLDIYLEGVNNEQVMVVKSYFSLDTAKTDIEKFIQKGEMKDSIYGKKLKQQMKNLIKKAEIHQEYYTVLGSLFHISSVEFSYNYYLNAKSYQISPQIYNTNIDINVFNKLFDGDYSFDTIANKTTNTNYSNIQTSEIIDAFEDSFSAHKISNYEFNYDQKMSIKMMKSQLHSKLKDLKQEELGVSRHIDNLNLVDYKYTYSTCIFIMPFYVFNYDTGKEIVTILYNAYNGSISTPILNNPLALLENSSEKIGIKPQFSVLFFILSFVIIILGPVCYILNYLLKSFKYKKKISSSLPYSEQLKLK